MIPDFQTLILSILEILKGGKEYNNVEKATNKIKNSRPHNENKGVKRFAS